MKQEKNKYTGPLCAGYLVLALVASAAEQTLITPPPSEFVDAESSVNVPIPTDEGRHIKLTIAFESNGDCPRFLLGDLIRKEGITLMRGDVLVFVARSDSRHILFEDGTPLSANGKYEIIHTNPLMGC